MADKNNRNRGAVLALMVILMLVLSLVSLTALQVGRDARLRSINSSNDIAARYLADAGIEQTMFLMNQALAQKAWNADSIPVLSSVSLAGTNGEYSVKVVGSISSQYEITSEGRSEQATRTVRVITRLTDPFALNYAILSQNTIDLKHNSTVTGFDSSDLSLKNLKADIGTLSDKNGSIDIKNGAEVNGDIYVGPTGNPNKVVLLKNRSDVKGELFNQPLEPPLMPVSAPTLSSKGKLTGKNIVLKTKDSGTYTSISIDNKGRLQIVGDCVLVVTGNVSLNNDADIQIDKNGSLIMYLEGDFDAKNSAGVVNESAIPAKFKLYGTGEAQTIEFKNSANLYGAVYAPNANMILHNGSNAYGSFIVKNFELKNSGSIFYDKALQNVDVTNEAVQFQIVRWEEL